MITYIRLILLLLVCIIISFTDIKRGKIQNQTIFFISGIGIVFDLIFYIFVERSLIVLFLSNAISLFLIGIILYAVGIWAGGDSKLLGVVAIIFPAELYWHCNYANCSLLAVLVLAFLSGYLYLFIDSLYFAMKHKKVISVKKGLNKVKTFLLGYLRTLVYIAAINQVYSYFVYTHIQINNVIYLSFLMLSVIVLNKFIIFKEKCIVLSFFVFDVGMVLFTGYVPISTKWENYIFIFVFMLMRIFFEEYNYEEINIDQLQEGMILSTTSTLHFLQSKVKGLPTISDESLKSRITKEELESIKRWKNSKYGRKTIVIVRKVPFAIFISIGIVLYLIIGEVLI
ncbi:prepilin peptidase [Anaeromicropila herbilytica]|uniref:Prepilin type IV endopeptidase peptidase domain-containing protein n=1 Tax=Anaeromicropila herbilytica TaxID=2785025 RepID=A0A7R7ELI2_9FIRM|nr:prepilin peptidase [Anaeromicropila herbilytica]BCN31080.1 hypothetical protein bsdtb5_23750 [Anaeromicropila herbilytica]